MSHRNWTKLWSDVKPMPLLLNIKVAVMLLTVCNSLVHNSEDIIFGHV